MIVEHLALTIESTNQVHLWIESSFPEWGRRWPPNTGGGVVGFGLYREKLVQMSGETFSSDRTVHIGKFKFSSNTGIIFQLDSNLYPQSYN